MNEDSFASLCAHLTPGQTVSVKTSAGGLLTGDFVRYEEGGMQGVMVLSSEGQLLVITSAQIVRLLPTDDQDTFSMSINRDTLTLRPIDSDNDAE